MKREGKWKTNSKMTYQIIILLNINTLYTYYDFVKIIFVKQSTGCQRVSHNSIDHKKN